MTLGTEWCTIEDVQQLIAEPYPEDSEITSAIEAATATLSNAFCVVPLDVDPEDTFPDDYSVRRATAILAAQVLTAPPLAGSVTPEAVESESIGGYSYRAKGGSRTQATALRIDGVVEELVNGYLCPDGTGVYELETIKTRHPYEIEAEDESG